MEEAARPPPFSFLTSQGTFAELVHTTKQGSVLFRVLLAHALESDERGASA